MSWLKTFGSEIAKVAKEIVHVLASPQAQTLENDAATLAGILLPAEAPLIAGFQTLAGKIFRQAAVTETAMANVSGSGAQKFSAVLAQVGPELDQWVANAFPGSGKIQDATKAGLINAIVALQNDITLPAAPPATPPTA